MDIRSLPETERAIYNGLRARYSLHFETTKISGQAIRLLTPSDLEELLGGQAPLENMSTFPFWSRQWDAGIVLAHTLIMHPHPQGRRLLELGAGLGLAGLAAALAGFEVTLSDNEDMILDFQRVSAAANGLSGIANIKVDLLDLPELELFDVIAGAEILFKEEFVEPMLTICQNCLRPGGTVYLANNIRHRNVRVFLEKAEKDFAIGSKKQIMTRDGKKTEVLVNRLQRRN